VGCPVADFIFDLNDDGTVRTAYKDGTPMTTTMRLELPTAIVHTYFKSAVRNLRQMTDDEVDHEANRLHGLQCFLMSLVGVEAFINVFFHQAGIERSLTEVINLANKDKTTIEHKLSHLPRQTYGSNLPAQKRLNKKMRELYDLRSKIVHPKWEPSSLAMPGLSIVGMVENEQQMFENRDLCREALCWCLLVIARIGMLARGSQADDHFVWYWTSLSETNASLSAALNVPPDGA